jgi:hypothetical protein
VANPGYDPDGFARWLRETHARLSAARAAVANAMAHNLERQDEIFAIQDAIEDAFNKTQMLCAKRGVKL